MNFDLIKKALKDRHLCIVEVGDEPFRKALAEYVENEGYFLKEYKNRYYIAKEAKRG